MPQIRTTPVQLLFMYGKAVEAVGAKGRCPKCWATEFAFKCFGCQTQMYTYPEPDGSGMWIFDVDKARELVGDRIDGECNPDVLIHGLGETEAGHEYCLLKRANAGKLPPMKGPVGIMARMGDDGAGALIIDGTHRGRLCIAAGVPMPIAILTQAEFDQVLISRPPNNILTVQQAEIDRMTRLFKKMNADFFFAEMAAILGKREVADILNTKESDTLAPGDQ